METLIPLGYIRYCVVPYTLAKHLRHELEIFFPDPEYIVELFTHQNMASDLILKIGILIKNKKLSAHECCNKVFKPF